MEIAGSTGSKRMLRKMEPDKISFLLIVSGLAITIDAPILWSDTDECGIDTVTALILGQAIIGLLLLTAGSFIYLLK